MSRSSVFSTLASQDVTAAEFDVLDGGITTLSAVTSGSLSSAVTFPTGHVLQTLSTTLTSAITIGVEDVITSVLSQSIIPSSTSSKILIRCMGSYGNDSADSFGHMLLYKDTVVISGAIGDSVGSAYRSTQNASLRTGGGVSNNVTRAFSFEYLDSPGVDVSVAYSIRAVSTNGTSMYIGRSGNTGDVNRSADITTITVMEIAG